MLYCLPTGGSTNPPDPPGGWRGSRLTPFFATVGQKSEIGSVPMLSISRTRVRSRVKAHCLLCAHCNYRLESGKPALQCILVTKKVIGDPHNEVWRPQICDSATIKSKIPILPLFHFFCLNSTENWITSTKNWSKSTKNWSKSTKNR